jgi:ribosomal protein S18 acetylase RimI-like enzyme
MIVLAREWGYSAVLSPLVPESGTAPYLEAGMSEHTRLVALTRAIGEESSVRASTPGLVRLATPEDRDALIALDARCFEPFWRYGPRELAAAFAADRVTVCEDGAGDVAGYVVITLRGVSATVSRIAVAPGARRAGLASAMMSDALRWATGVRAMGVSLCTQADNVGSRALYRATGFAEVAEGYSLLVSGAQPR